MGTLAKLFTAMRGAANEAGEAIVDSQALRILDQEMRQAEKEMREAKTQMTVVMAQRAGVAREVERLRSAIAEHEVYAAKALDKNDEALATDVAIKIADFEEDFTIQTQSLAQYEAGVNQLRRTIKTTERNLAAMKRQVSMVKATEKVQKASAAASQRFSGSASAMTSATESLERIKRRQQERADRMDAAGQLAAEENGGELDARLRAAGIVKGGTSADDVLARIRAKRAG